MNQQNYLNPVEFARESLDFMQGTPRWKIWLLMPLAYVRTVYYTWRERRCGQQEAISDTSERRWVRRKSR